MKNGSGLQIAMIDLIKRTTHNRKISLGIKAVPIFLKGKTIMYTVSFLARYPYYSYYCCTHLSQKSARQTKTYRTLFLFFFNLATIVNDSLRVMSRHI